MRSLRTLLLASHLFIVMLMIVVMIGAVINFFRLSRSINRILKANYASVIAAQNMKESLERQDSATTFFLAGQADVARKQFEANIPIFQKWYNVEAHNITEPGEQQLANNLGAEFPAYRAKIHKLLYANPAIPASAARQYYFDRLEPDFLRIKQCAQDILDLNQRAIIKADADAKAEARRASYSAIGMTLVALVLALFLARESIHAALTPLRAFVRQADEIGAGHLEQRVALNRNDEIGALASAFNHMAEKLYEAKLIDEQRLHRAQSMSDAALESLYDPVIVTDASARVVHLNRAGEDLYGLEKNVAGMSVSDIVRDDRIARAVDRAIGQERVYASEDESALILLKVGGSKRSYRLRVSPMRDGVGPILGAVAVLEDVTQLRELDRLKTEFISVASHELRTPVTSLLLSVQLLQEGAVGQLSLEQKQVIDAQREDLDRLEHLMRDLLDIARLEAGVMPPKFENVDPKDLAQTAIAELSSIAAAKGVRLIDNVPEELSSAWADRLQIGRVLVNLLSNAVRHTAADGTVSVAAREENEMIVFNVQDNGVGISPEYLPRIFDRFIQAPGAARGGAGLGLSLAKTIIKAHGGAIKATSELGAGTIFTFTLPMMAENSRKG